jgi:hypothetical protein
LLISFLISRNEISCGRIYRNIGMCVIHSVLVYLLQLFLFFFPIVDLQLVHS